MSEKPRKTFLREHIKKEISGLFWMAAGLFLLLSLVSFNNNDPSFNNNLDPTQISNFCGRVGAYVSDLFYQIIGIPAMMISIAGLISLKIEKVALFGQTLNQAGGFIGYFLASTLKSWFNLTGAAIFLVVFFSVSSMLVARFSMVLFLEGLLAGLAVGMEKRREARKARRDLREADKPKREKAPVIRAPQPAPAPVIKESKKNSKKKAQANQEAFEFLEPSGTYHPPSRSE